MVGRWCGVGRMGEGRIEGIGLDVACWLWWNGDIGR